MHPNNLSRPYGAISGSTEEGLEANVILEKKTGNRYFNTAIAALTISIVLVCTATISLRSGSNLAATSESSAELNTFQGKRDSDKKPNIVMILIDDLGYDEINSLSATTPFIRDLADKGVKLTQYYTQETCTPARASLMTGRYPISTGVQFGVVTSTEEFGLEVKETLLPEVLKDKGNYKNYMIGKWNLGHFSPEFLPTARGFDYFLGFLDGQNSYWSKAYPSKDDYTDFMYADTECYEKYDGIDMTTYSSQLYGQKAINVIKKHDFDANPMFLYFASQAVHDPFTDDIQFPEGGQSTYTSYDTWSDSLTKKVFNQAVASSDLFLRQNYALSLAVLDTAVEDIYKTLNQVGQLDNTYIIVASDNGGCFAAGAMNGGLRGTKGSLFEGGTKVDAFVYSSKLTSGGSEYSGIMHVTDWFPTILGFAGINYHPSEDYKLDGFDQSSAFVNGEESNPREFLLYNAIINVEDKDLDIYSNAPVAVRNSQYKLIHAFTGNPSSTWYTVDQDSDVSCPQSQSMAGDFKMMLFDLLNDPNEENDLYGTTAVAGDQELLYQHISKLQSKMAKSTYNSATAAVTASWDAGGSFVQPWKFPGSSIATTSYPKKCAKSDNVFSPIYK